MWRGRGPRGLGFDAVCVIEAAAAASRAWVRDQEPDGKAWVPVHENILQRQGSRPMGRSGVCGFHSLAFMVHAVRLALRRVRQGHQEMYEVRQHSLLVEPSPLDVLANIRQSIRHLGTGRANISSRHNVATVTSRATWRRSRRGTRYRR